MSETVQYETRKDYPAGQNRNSMQPGQDIVDYLKAYAREKPDVAALWCLGVGFILGWKLKPW
jgi:hypothetical protein